jgi:hypothetical protein
VEFRVLVSENLAIFVTQYLGNINPVSSEIYILANMQYVNNKITKLDVGILSVDFNTL